MTRIVGFAAATSAALLNIITPVPKSRGGLETVPIHPICHRTLHHSFSNAELALFGDSLATVKADPRIGRFLAWIVNKDPEFHAPTHRGR